MIAKLVIAFALFASSAMSRAGEPENLRLFLLAGQSNMAGRGNVTPDDQKPLPRVWMLNAEDQWVPAIDPMHRDKPAAGVGPGRAFALALAEADPDIEIGLIPCAQGGSPIEAWLPGVSFKQTNSHPWDDAIRRTKIAMKSGTLKGILWHQGESDCTPALAPAYEGKLHDLIARFRKELNAPEIPFIAGQMGRFDEKPWNAPKKQVDQAHRDLPSKVPNTGFAPSDGLHHRGDALHFDSDSCRKLGQRYAEAFRKVTAKK